MQLLQGMDGGFFAAFAAMWVIAMLIVLAVFVLAVLVTVQAYQAGREGWWIYLIALFISPFNLIAVIYWFAHGKNNPVLSNGRPFL